MSSEAQSHLEGKQQQFAASPIIEKVSSNAAQELQLREELRHSRLLAETYQARTLELERLRLGMDEEVSRMRHEREKDDMQKKENRL